MTATRFRRPPPWALWLGMAAAALGIGIGLGMVIDWLDAMPASPERQAAIGGAWLAALAGGAALMVLHWRLLDELAREAHKSAWFWGGSLGLAVGAIAMTPLGLSIGPWGAWVAGLGADAAASAGALGGIVGAFVGYQLTWLAFWLTKR